MFIDIYAKLRQRGTSMSGIVSLKRSIGLVLVICVLCGFGFGSESPTTLPSMTDRAQNTTATTKIKKGDDITQGMPDIEFDALQKSIEIERGATANFTFHIRNTGNETLNLMGVSGKTPGQCYCKNTEYLEKENISPGESIRLFGKIVSPRELGTFNRIIRVNSNDPDEKTTTLTLTFTVTSDVIVMPERVSFGEVQKRDTAQRIVRIEATTEPPLEIKNLAIRDSQLVTAKVLNRNLNPHGKGDNASTRSLTTCSIQLELNPRGKKEPVNGRLEIATNLAKYPTIVVPFYGKISSDMIVNPSGIYFGVTFPGTTYTRTLTLRSRSNVKFNITDIETEDPRISWKKLDSSKPHEKKIQLTLIPSEKQYANYKRRLTIQTDHPSDKTIETSVKYFVHHAKAPREKAR